MKHVPIIISATEHERLQRLVDLHLGGRNAALAEGLAQELARAQVRDHVPAAVVRMSSRVVFEDLASGERRTATLSYPHEAGGDGRISVLAPVGSALLGLAVGQEIDWAVPGGLRTLRILAVAPPAEEGRP